MITTARSTTRASAAGPPRAALLGATDERLRDLLTDVIGDLGLAITVGADATAAPPDVVVVVVDRDEVGHSVAEARALAGRAKVLVILPFGDARQVRRLISAGADAVFELDAPLSHLRISIVRLLEESAAGQGSAGARAKTPFQLGPRAKAALSAIRKNRGGAATGSAALPEDAGKRLEQAIDIDLHLDRERAATGARPRFTFGSHAMLEMMLLSLSGFEISLLEHAIASDLSRQR